jgi:hypothetical protein
MGECKMAISRAALMPIIRHECGHLVVAHVVGFSTDGIELRPDRAGAYIDLQLAFTSVDDVCSYIENRVQVLFAGAIAQSIQGNVIRPEVAHTLLDNPREGSGHDFAKIKELIRVFVGLKFPDANREQYANALTATDHRLSEASAHIVSDKIKIIDALALHFLDEMEKLGKRDSYHFPQAKIDEFLASH